MTPTSTTTPDIDELAELGDSIASAQRQRAERQLAQSRRARALRNAESALATTIEELEVIDAELAVKLPVVLELEKRRDELAERIADTRTPAASDLFEVDANNEALRQATQAGAPVFHGVSLHESGGESPLTVRVPDPLLGQVAAELGLGAIDWTHATTPLQDRAERLRRDAERLCADVARLTAAAG